MKKTWWKESVVYEIYPRSFCDSNGDGIGDLNGITGKLDYLSDLGINVIWLAPVYKSPNDDNGYDISDYRDIMDEFGTMEDYDHLLEEAHKRGIKIVMDLVANHTSDEHAWFVESRSSRDNDKRDYYIWRDPVDGKEPTNWGSCFGGSAWEWDEKTGQYYLHCFSRKQPDLNWDNPRVREEVFDLMRFWCEKGIDGFRMDVISMISKKPDFVDAPVDDGIYGNTSLEVSYGPHLHEYLKEMNQKVLARYDLMTVGECGGVTTEHAKKIANAEGTELGMVFQFEHVSVDGGPDGKWYKKPMPLPALKENLSKWQRELDGRAWNSLFFGNHDQPRIVSRIGDNSPISAKAAAVALYSMQGTPYLYQGEELGMTNYPFKGIEDYDDLECINAYHQIVEAGFRDPEELLEAIAYKSRDNARTPMQWSDEENAGFTTGTPWFHINPNYREINAKSQIYDPDSVYSFYKRYFALRTDSPWKNLLVYGKYQLLAPEDEAVFAYIRYADEQKLLVVCNLSAADRTFEVPESVQIDPSLSLLINPDESQLLISTYKDSRLSRTLLLRPWEAGIWAV
ncbi:MAG: alpha-glucosidase [Eubacterium sp.]|nr:alpha-glucosidase [Eubacterium sp.]